jgi:hypothetical protein
MGLFEKLALFCVDTRSEVRKSANQTLFSAITTHGSLFQPSTWRTFLWDILFPFVERVNAEYKASETAAAPTQAAPG